MSTMSDPDPQIIKPAQEAPAADLSQYIRTYAKDVAQVSGKGNIGAVPVPKPHAVTAVPPPARAEENSDGVQFDAIAEPYLEQTAAQKKDLDAPIQLESKLELDSFVTHEKTKEPEKEKSVEHERSNILVRLKSKMSKPIMVAPVADVPSAVYLPEPVVSTPPTSPVLSTPVPPPIEAVFRPAVMPPVPEQLSVPVPPPAPVPVFEKPPEQKVYAIPPLYREPIEEVPPAPVQRPPVLPVAVAPLPKAAPERFHSFSTDFRDHSTNTKATDFSVLAASLDAGQTMQSESSRQASRGSKPPIIAIILGVVLLVLAGGGAYALYLYVGARHTVPAITLYVPSLIFADEYKKIEGTGPELMRALAAVASEPLPAGNAVVTYVAQPATGQAGTITGTPAPGGVLVHDLALSAPDLLLRNINEESTVGVIHEGDESRAFFVLRVSSYERSFAAMLTWEPLMARELGLLYPLYPALSPAEPDVSLTTATTTATSTPATPKSIYADEPVVSTGRFDDVVVANRDVRILRDTRGRSLLLYGYADKQTLIIARDEAAFSALILRLSAGGK